MWGSEQEEAFRKQRNKFYSETVILTFDHYSQSTAAIIHDETAKTKVNTTVMKIFTKHVTSARLSDQDQNIVSQYFLKPVYI